jgi:protocatechuate 3,4-dioxygenase beta subunit
MSNDDETVGTLLSRREALAIVAGSTALLATGPLHAAPTGKIRLPACVVRPAQTEGPYFLDRMLERSDIRSEPTDGAVSAGKRLALDVQVSRVAPGGCTPLAGAVVDIWQCDAAGVYSGVRDISGQFDTTGKQFLRGHQRTDAAGMARFVTVYPGWYHGRAVHIHFKIRTNAEGARGYDFTSQVYFDEKFTDQVYVAAPYNAKSGRRVLNPADNIYRSSGGSQLMLTVERRDDGYQALFDVGLQMT